MKKQILLIALLIFGLFFIISIFKKSESSIDDQCNFGVHRFEQDFFNLPADNFDVEFMKIKKKYPSFFNDTTIHFKEDVFLNDTLNAIFDSVSLIFHNTLPELDKLQKGFCNYKKHFPLDSFSLYTYIEGTFDYRYPVVFANEKLFVSLDLFLGANLSFYNSFPDYIKFSHDTVYLPSSCFITLAGRHIPIPSLDNFLSSILHYAKAYFFAQKMLLNVPEYYLFKCKKEKMQWCQNNEKVIWQYMIENDYLFSTSPELIERFVSLAPFSKFGLDIDIKSPGGVGVWLGLQILNAYSENNNIP